MVKKAEFIWNMIGSIIAASLSMVLLLAITRINGVDAAGLYSITFATSTVLFAVADFGMRVFQVTDHNRSYHFEEYLTARIVVNIIMIILAGTFFIIEGYETYKSLICLGFVLFRFIDGISETYQGEFQLNGRLDIAGKSVSLRTALAIVIFIFVDIITKNMLLSVYLLTATNFIMFMLYDLLKIKEYKTNKVSLNMNNVMKIIVACFPLFVALFLNNYIINAPKYAIDELLDYDMQTYFNILYLPTFTINLMSIFVLKPMLKTLGECWAKGEIKGFLNVSKKISLLILLLTLIVGIVCYFIGIPILQFIFNLELGEFRNILMILVLSGGLSAFTVEFLYILSTMRLQRASSICYLIVAILALIFPKLLVRSLGLLGAALSSLMLMFVLSILLLLTIFYYWRKIND